MAKKKNPPENKKTPKKQQPDALPAPSPVTPPETKTMPPSGPWKVIKEGLVWLVIWTCLFCCFDGCRRVIRDGLPSIHFEWRRNDAKTSLGRWILAERPPLLKADYPAVGKELAETARRLRAGKLTSQNAASADTIARVQPVVSEQNTWRVFISRMNGEIQGGNLEKLAEQYDDAAGMFGHTKAVETLVEAVPTIMEETDNEESTDEADIADSDSPGPLDDERQDQVENQADDSGPDSGPLPSAETETGGGAAESASAGSGCPTGQCPTTYPRSNPSYPWTGYGYGYGLPW